MLWLIALPAWVILWSFCLNKSSQFKISTKSYMILCSLALIFIMGLRSKYTGTADTYHYTLLYEAAKEYSTLGEYLNKIDIFNDVFIFSEAGFHIYTWIAAKIFSGTQGFLLLTATIIVGATAKFIYENSEDPAVSWVVFICLGSMTFAMNGMRQALAMSICLLSYRYVKEKKLVRFLLTVFLAVLFHKSAMVFALVYLMRNMKFNFKSFAWITLGIGVFLASAQRFAFLYDSITGEDYASAESFESGGIITILIYVIAIVGLLISYRQLQDTERFLPLVFTIVGLFIYLGRFISTQIYERVSYYFAYFLILGFPIILNDMKPNIRQSVRIIFMVVSGALFAYRIGKGAFSDFEMFWQIGLKG